MSTLQVLLIIAFLVIGIRKAYKKSKAEQVDNPNQRPMDEKEEDYRNDNRNREEEQEAPLSPKFGPKTVLYTDSIKSSPFPVNTGAATPFPSQTLLDENEESDEDFSISSPEDVRRAIVWSEILHRKY
ncbi:hypothetical protein EZS27_006017 [termite gut metagenome]|uniref:Uncharacterized protein n=1 Tax=termite gut metagenome TaxID=433724 RepID=A0A5J4SKM2_9ZZZZ